ncbi:hypothetical protein NDU88_001712 [Pleurodeles waltl]|uniref:Uncharacterized protein n=1 Tax=Pleurodeles waltl TaxID=8319 RepID=A0AAV7UW48_PLEWA|nr:hypothetical protein NDU88_001712 [Pleurodeles waltl]
MLRLFPFGRTPGGFPPGVSRSPGPSSTVALVACRTLLTSLRSPGAPTAGGAPIAAPSPPGWIRRRSALQSGSDAATPAAGSAGQARGAARDTGSSAHSSGLRGPPLHRDPRSRPQRRLPLANAAPPVQAATSRSKQLRVSSPGGFRLRRPFSCSCRVARAGLRFATTLGPQLDGEITGMVSTAPLGR